MEIEGKIIQFLGEQSGVSKAGKPWKKKEWVLETFGNFPRKVKFHIFGERADSISLEPGNDYVLSFDIESREFNGRWYTDISVFRAEPYNGGQNAFGNPNSSYQGNGYPQNQQNYQNQGSFGAPQQGYQVNPDAFAPAAGESDEDLPF